MFLSIAVCVDGAFKAHDWRAPFCNHSSEEYITALKAEVAKLTGEWIVIDLQAKSVYAQLDWWKNNPWARSDTAVSDGH